MSEPKKILLVTNSTRPAFALLPGLREEEGETSQPLDITILSPNPSPDWEKSLADIGVKLNSSVRARATLSSILSTANRENPFLIMIDHLGSDPEDTKTFSIIKSLLKKSNYPVLFVPTAESEPEPPRRGLFSHVLLATDWTPTSENAYNYLLHFKCNIKSLEIINVISEGLTIRTVRELKTRIEQKRKVCCQEHCLDAEAHIYAGNAQDEILKAAHDYHVSCIVLGAKRKTGVKEFFRKRTGWRVAQRSLIPVLIVPTGVN